MIDVPGWLHGLYLFTTVFGVGVTAIDLLGIFGEHHQDSHSGDGGSGESGHPQAAHDHEPGDMHGDGVGSSLLLLLRYLRMAVYFSLGFGPLGLVATATGAGLLGSLAWAIPGGLVAALLAHAFLRWQQHDVDSSVQDYELLAERAVVLVPLSHTSMGRVRLTIGQSMVERYALAEQVDETFRTGEEVEIVRVTEDCVYVQHAIGRRLER